MPFKNDSDKIDRNIVFGLSIYFHMYREVEMRGKMKEKKNNLDAVILE